MELLELTEKLYRRTGDFNLYIYLCYEKNKPDIIRLKEELNNIKKLVLDIEKYMDCI